MLAPICAIFLTNSDSNPPGDCKIGSTHWIPSPHLHSQSSCRGDRPTNSTHYLSTCCLSSSSIVWPLLSRRHPTTSCTVTLPVFPVHRVDQVSFPPWPVTSHRSRRDSQRITCLRSQHPELIPKINSESKSRPIKIARLLNANWALKKEKTVKTGWEAMREREREREMKDVGVVIDLKEYYWLSGVRKERIQDGRNFEVVGGEKRKEEQLTRELKKRKEVEKLGERVGE